MKKGILSLSVVTLTLLFSASIYAAALTQDSETEIVTVPGPTSDGGNLVFAPSNNIVFTGACSESSFLYASHHSGVVQKASGKQFAMAADSTQVFWRDISGRAPQVLTAADTVAADLDGDWNSH